LKNQKEPNNGLSLEVKDPLDEQLYSPSAELSKTNITCQSNIYDEHGFLLTDVIIRNLEESLQNSLIEKYSKTQSKVSPAISRDN